MDGRILLGHDAGAFSDDVVENPGLVLTVG